MSDRELLELAAKAAGIVGKWATGHQAYGDQDIEGIDTGARFWWNPLDDDGDALRLAVKLNIDLMGQGHMHDGTPCRSAIYPICGDFDGISEPDGEDQYVAARRVIVLAAAAIGKAMP